MVFCYQRAGAEAEQSRDFAGAEKYYRAGLAIEREHAGLQAQLGALLLIQRRFADAVAPLEVYHRLQPENPQSALFLGQAYVAVGRRAEARRILVEGVQLAEHAGNAATAQRCREILRQVP
jgi:predicted Zn-dependent protease